MTVMLQEIPLPTIPAAYAADIERAQAIVRRYAGVELFLFGSLADGQSDAWSDIDLAVSGCAPERFLTLYGDLVFGAEHKVDVVDLDSTSPFLNLLKATGRFARLV